ncbi:hypothetical protein [Pseudoalteromonas rubra]|uniref:DUF2306 domain-containing protein n=1 Tax=Pseudoalteromonas rubra TaxID=43658 RepID=A0A0F4QL59_9GAMM|nr:hypothetical protein [Pseudoalteromonas rubra]KJZ07995.1 hypothetical protein TW77_14220 [Pseudoalteromonas rubra]
MSEFYVVTGWTLRFLQLMVVIYLLYYFKQYRFSLLFGGKSNLKTLADHKLHSCFLTALALLVFQTTSRALATYIMGLDIALQVKIQIYYFALVCCGASYAVALYILHLLRGSMFSQAARYSLYLTFALVILNALQLLLRGFLESNLLYSLYGPVTVCVNIALWLVVAKYPFYRFMETRIRQEA